MDSQTIELNLPNVLGYERVAMGCAESFAKSLCFKKERIEDLKTAVAEACSNAIRHGNKGLGGARVRVSMCHKNGDFHVVVTDKGNGILKLPTLPDIGKLVDGVTPLGGFGLFLIKELVDHVDFNEMTSHGHAVHMVMKKNA